MNSRAIGPAILAVGVLAGCETSGASGSPTASAHAQASNPTSASTPCIPAVHPAARFGAAIAYDATRKVVVLFGGARGEGPAALGDTWTWDGCRWSPRTATPSPPGRSFGAMVYDPGHSNVVLLGGGAANADPARSDTWIWDGQGWSERHPATSPPVMSGVDLVYDRAHSVVVMVGQSQRGDATETWTWNGQTWTQQHPAHQPDPRSGAATAYGVKSGILYYGGTSGFGDPLNDIWVYDGSDWGRLAPRSSPGGGPARMVRDDGRGNVVMLESDGTWLWDGANWAKAQPPSAPPNEIFRAITYDAASRQVLVVGGKSEQTNVATDEVWAWDGATWTRR